MARYVVPMMILPAVLMGFLTWMVMDAFTSVADPVAMGFPVGAALWVVFTLALLLGGRRRAARRELTLSDQGLTSREQPFETHIAWHGLQGFALANVQESDGKFSSWLSEGTTSIKKAGNSYMIQPVLYGTGEVRAIKGSGRYRRFLISGLYGVEGSVATVQGIFVVPEFYEHEWREGAIGEALRVHRPDIAIPGPDSQLPWVQREVDLS